MIAVIITTMTLTLYALRHAQATSAGNDSIANDKDRPLTEKGLVDLAHLGHFMKDNGLQPDFCACSAARRTRQTFKALTASLGNIPARYDDDLYNATTGTLYEAIKTTDSRYQSLLLVAHNPGIHGIAMFLADHNSKRQFITGYPPGSLTVLEFNTAHWRDIMPDSGTIKYFRTV